MKVSRLRTPVALVAGLVALFAAAGCAGSATPSTSQKPRERVTLEEKMIPSDPGVRIYLRHKYPARKESFGKDRVVLFLEPFSIPTARAFDVPGHSWMNAYAEDGYDTWAMDFRGFGRSTRPAAMNRPAQQNKPVVRHGEAVRDLAAAVEYIKKRRHVSKVDIVGWSYGAVVAGEYAGLHPGDVGKLVLVGFMHGFNLPIMAGPYASKQDPNKINDNLPAYQTVAWPMAMTHWHHQKGNHDWVSEGVMEKVGKVYTSSDPTSGQREDNGVRRPMGPLVDLYYIWTNRPLYDLSKVKAPTLVIRGAADFMAEKGVLRKLTGTKVKKEVVIPDATHWALYEKSSRRLTDGVKEFLER